MHASGCPEPAGAARLLAEALGLHDGLPDGIFPLLGDYIREHSEPRWGGVPDGSVPGPVDAGLVRDLVMERARSAPRFSVNDFYRMLPPEAHHLIDPAFRGLRGQFEAIGTEIAVNPARKGSRVTVYSLRSHQGASRG